MFLLSFLRRAKSRLLRVPAALFIRPKLESIPFEITRIGTKYGGWCYAKTSGLTGSNAVFCGAGEDISFDIGFASAFGANVFIVDPTPRAVTHVNSVLSRVGLPSETCFVAGGKQDPQSYDLSSINPNQIQLVEFALWNKSCILKFYAPRNHEHVSYSILNYQNSYSSEGSFIEVQALSMTDLIESNLIPSNIAILKLDIEGAEHEVIANLIDSGHRPCQILVEYDELLIGSLRGISRFKATHHKLTSIGYKLFSRESSNFSYLFDPS